MRKLVEKFLQGVALALGMLAAVAVAQVTRSIQMSQDPTGQAGYDLTNHHIHFAQGAGGAQPPVVSNGSVVGTDQSFQWTTGGTSGTVTFAAAFTGAGGPTCDVTPINNATYPTITSISTTVITFGTVVNGAVYHVNCWGR